MIRILQLKFKRMNLRRTQDLTEETVEPRRIQSRRTSVSQAARIAGVTCLGSLKAAAGWATELTRTEPMSSLAAIADNLTDFDEF